MHRVLFVCLGNICRSPAAEGLLRHMAKQDPSLQLTIDSCGIGNWHVGSPPNMQMQEAAIARGIPLTGQAKQFQMDFFDQFDLILAADHEVVRDLYRIAKTPEHKAKIGLMTDFSSSYKGEEVPDPYMQQGGLFDLVLDILEDSCEGILNHLHSLNDKR